jgi:hypothetical protein
MLLGIIGLSLIYSIADFTNFAHGDTMTVGALLGARRVASRRGRVCLPCVTFGALCQ